jgi:hypothetical protein
MIRIAITPAAHEAICSTLPESKPNRVFAPVIALGDRRNATRCTTAMRK